MYEQNDPYKNQQQHGHYQQQPQPPYMQAAPQQYAYGYGPPPAQPLYPPVQQQQQAYFGEPADAHIQGVNSIKPEQSPSTGCRDWPFAIVFILNVAAIIGLMAVWGIGSVSGSDSDTSANVLSADDTKKVIGITLGMSVVSVVLALILVKLITTKARFMINFVLWFNVGVAIAVAAYGFTISNLFLGILGVIIALLNFCYARAVQHRIPFAVANLHVAERAISKHKTTYLVAIVFTIVQIAWVVVWALALLGVANNMSTDESTTGYLNDGATCTTSSQCISNSCKAYSTGRQCASTTSQFFKASAGNYIAYFFMLISFYWGLQVFKNIAHVTVSGTVATFWYNSESKGATGSSLKRATTTSFGSICFGSLLVAILQALRALAESQREEGSFLSCICECILGCLQSLMEYFNRWAFVYVGIYGYKFTQAGKAVIELFHTRGFDAIINDDLIGNVLSFAALGVGLICAGIGGIVGETTNIFEFENSTLFLAVLGFLVGIGVSITPLAVIDSSVATIFVCFAEDPAAFMQSHPDLYNPLITEWHNLYPEIMVQSGYWHA
jgi:hypothetical protein